jgi:alpha,alpha-trehalase
MVMFGGFHVLFFVTLAVASVEVVVGIAPTVDPCGPVFCNADMLSVVQGAELFGPDNKEFVDMPMKRSPEEVVKKFYAGWNHSDPQAIRTFVEDCFEAAGSDLTSWTPDDWSPSLPEPFVSSIRDDTLKALAFQVHEVWHHLGKKLSDSVYSQPERHSLLPLRHPTTIVAGGRFRETYYWDSFWVVKGLLHSGMYQSARHLVENLLHLVKTYGFVPNGGRSYYLRRSQPPLLAQMVHEVFVNMKQQEPEQALQFLREAVTLLDAEYSFWMTSGQRAVDIECPVGQPCRVAEKSSTSSNPTDTMTLNRFYVDQPYPRPEAYTVDRATAESVPESFRADLFRHLAAGAESGWDYSSRWMGDHLNLHSLITSHIIPADLNAIMYRNELTLARMHLLLGDLASSQRYLDAGTKRWSAIKALLWDESLHRWGDYVLEDSAVRFAGGQPGRTTGTGVANFIPLWAKCHLPPPRTLPDLVTPAAQFVTSSLLFDPIAQLDAAQQQEADAILDSLADSGLVLEGGAVTMVELPIPTDEQWDFPNAWPPLQHLLVEGLQYLGTPESSQLAFKLAQQFVSSTFIAHQKSGLFLEKYDARTPGSPGGGGEYSLQEGFGWTNGVLLDLLSKYGSELTAPFLSNVSQEL